ncbi:MAG: pyridoxamine 5'-phosphate oxidase [Bacteroidales bacterium]|nr:pyridoxamine 5'-phosphate oxidase [Bacteroidales bacterium]MBN2699142.1 pyridoxamine 5'-phosphate oxidase [Bacteroidales bacterium]
MRDFGDVRREYLKRSLTEENLPDDPFLLFNLWLNDALNKNLPEPTAMNLSTVGIDGQPSSRIVLLKKTEKNCFIFFTNYTSRKALDISLHLRVSALFFWPELERQVKIMGIAAKINDAESVHYFQSRPYESQIGAWASPQSKEIPDRTFLEKEFEKYRKKFPEEKPVPKPTHWGGYAIIPSRIEFWQGRKARLHDRIEYRKKGEEWMRVRLAP